ncbi:class I adenylate-forming enzyme family protein [Neobacillus vireti]|uniref:Acyl-CoA synthetase n=1 Tax=Neobacillus vireti LMG 21834 TaxID=1131730 RepID=A0AB94IP93_9BACI|nr:AMP-binding protein [Neobacillus vireti]ETI68832.1 acyl-CoA synthetase [Neobacillus vireti LMG 21834]KLT19614.1 long-chain fatty acid--CoA ligase [Neobacillus vireti]
MKVNFGRLMLQQAKHWQDRIALVNIERNRSFTFKELHLLTNRICNMMKNQFGLTAGDVFACLLENDNNSLFTHWMWKGEASAVWLNYRDSFEEHMYQIDYLSPKVIFVERVLLSKSEYYEALRARGIEIIVMDQPASEQNGVHYFWDLIRGESDAETNVEYELDEHIVLYRFTGGTTGRGKCAMYTLKNMMAAVSQSISHPENLFDNHMKLLHVAPLSHGTALFVLPVYFKGGTNYTINLPNPEHLCEAIQDHQLTSAFVVPTLLYRLLDLGLEKKYNLTSLNKVFYGAAPMSPAKLESLQNKLGNIFIQVYGSTEAWPLVMVLGKKDHVIETEQDRKRISSTGRPLCGVEMGIFDEEGNEVPVGGIGEIWIRSESVIKGYYKAPEETDAGFSNGFWKSGDMGFVDADGYFYIVDRKKDMIITGGFNVYAIEVENALNANPAVQQSAVVGIPHEEWGEAVHAEVVINEGMKITKEELIEFTLQKIGKYKAPKSVRFVDELPTTAVGKILRRSVRERYWQGQTRKVH